MLTATNSSIVVHLVRINSELASSNEHWEELWTEL